MTYTKNNGLYENGEGKKIVAPSKLNLWTFYWGHGEHERLLVIIIFSVAITFIEWTWRHSRRKIQKGFLKRN